MTMILEKGINLAQKQTMKNAGNEESLESIYKNGKICFQKKETEPKSWTIFSNENCSRGQKGLLSVNRRRQVRSLCFDAAIVIVIQIFC